MEFTLGPLIITILFYTATGPCTVRSNEVKTNVQATDLYTGSGCV